MNNIFFKLPLYIDDKQPIEKISLDRINTVKSFEKKIENKTYEYVYNNCLCGNTDKQEDILLSEKDRYGISVRFLLCKKCSIIRTDKKLNDKSLADFYSKYYREIYGNGLLSIEDEYNGQIKKGDQYRELLKKHIPLDNVKSVFDFGCGTGGALHPFKEDNKLVFGSDYNYDRLNHGKENGLNLLHAVNDSEEIDKKRYDLIMLSHVMEHFSNPILELNDLFELISDEGFILIIVPSPLNIGKSPQVTCRFFQNVHLYNFNKEYLVGFFKKLGMKVVYIDEVCHCILQKPKNWLRNDIEIYDDIELKTKYKEIIDHFKKVIIMNDILKIYIVRNTLVKILDILKIKKIVKKLIYKIKD